MYFHPVEAAAIFIYFIFSYNSTFLTIMRSNMNSSWNLIIIVIQLRKQTFVSSECDECEQEQEQLCFQ